MNFAVSWLFAKVFSAKFWGIVSFGAAKGFLCESCIFTNSQKFSPSKVFCYTVCNVTVIWAIYTLNIRITCASNFLHYTRTPTVMIWDDQKRKFVFEIGFSTRVLSVRMRRDK